MDIEQPLPQPRAPLLDLPLARLVTLDRAVLLLAAILLLTAISRFWMLGERALHHDESLHAVFSYYLFDRGEHIHEPLMHGPLLFHLTALGYVLFGDSDFTVRLVPALLGILAAWVPWKFRGWLGRRGALVASFGMLVSPTMLYYSRFIREDIFAGAWTLLIVYGMWQYLRRGEHFHLYVMVAGWALLFSQKEISFLLAFLFWSFLALLFVLRWRGWLGPKVAARESREFHLLVVLGALLLPFTTAVLMHAPTFLNEHVGLSLPILDPGVVGGNSETSVYNSAAGWPLPFKLRAYATAIVLGLLGLAVAARLWSWRVFLVAAALFYAIFAPLHTNWFTNPHGMGSGIIGALGYWIEQHEVQRGEQPWFYYGMLLPLYEFMPLLLGLGGSLLLLLRGHGRAVAPAEGAANHLDARALWPWFNLWWFFGAFALFSFAGEKMPWLLLHMAIPLILLMGWAVGRVLDGVEPGRFSVQDALLFGSLVALEALALLALFYLLLSGRAPFRGWDEGALLATARWLLAALFLLGAGWGASILGERLGGRAARQIALMGLGLLLTLATVRYAYLVTFINGDTPNEPLIFVQTSPNVTGLMDDLALLSERLAGDRNLVVAYDNFSSWPFEWYLRDYPNRFFYSNDPQNFADGVRNADVILVGHPNYQAIQPLVAGYVRHDFEMRWWFPEEYKSLYGRFDAEAVRLDGEDKSPLNVWRNVWRLAQNEEYRRDFVDFVVNRQLRHPLGGEELSIYLKPELAARVWQFQGTGQPIAAPGSSAPSLPAAPPDAAGYAARLSEREPSTTLSVGFRSPKSVAVLADGTLAVADSGNHRILLLSPQGDILATFGGAGTEPGQFNEPWAIAAAPDGTLYVADTWNHRVQHLDSEGNVLHVWGSYADSGGTLDQPGTLWGPRGIAVGRDGSVWVTDTGNKRVAHFTPEGTLIEQFGGAGSEPGRFQEPAGIAIGPDGTIWVADTWNRRIQGFSSTWEPLAQFEVPGWVGQGVLNKPALAASAERLWLSDPEAGVVAELDLDGTLLHAWGGPGLLNVPLGLAWDGEQLWVAESEANRLLAYPAQGD